MQQISRENSKNHNEDNVVVCAWCSPKAYTSTNQGNKGFRICGKHKNSLQQQITMRKKRS